VVLVPIRRIPCHDCKNININGVQSPGSPSNTESAIEQTNIIKGKKALLDEEKYIGRKSLWSFQSRHWCWCFPYQYGGTFNSSIRGLVVTPQHPGWSRKAGPNLLVLSCWGMMRGWCLGEAIWVVMCAVWRRSLTLLVLVVALEGRL